MKCARFYPPLTAVGLLLFACAVLGQETGTTSSEQIASVERHAPSSNAQAEYNRGQSFAVGDGVPKDLAEAAKWFRKAAEQGLAVAQGRLANALLHGWGVTQNTNEALEWYRKAADQGDVASAELLGEIYEDGGPLEIITQPNGSYTLGHVPQSAAIPNDFAKAAYWYRAAANFGSAVAQNHLGILYRNGKGVPQDYIEAYFWLSLGEAGGIPSTTNGVDDRDIAAAHLTKTALLQVQERTRKWFEDHTVKPQ